MTYCKETPGDEAPTLLIGDSNSVKSGESICKLSSLSRNDRDCCIAVASIHTDLASLAYQLSSESAESCVKSIISSMVAKLLPSCILISSITFLLAYSGARALT